MSKYAYNPFTSNLDIAGSESYIDGVVATPASLPVTLNTPALDSVYLAKAGSGVWLINRRPAGLYCRVANNGNLNDWVALGAFPEINADGNWEIYNSTDPTKELKFDLSGISTGTTRTLIAPNANGTIALTSQIPSAFDPASPGTIGGTTPAAATFTNLTANTRLNLPNANGTTAGDIYRSGATLRYLDNAGTPLERIILNHRDNLANLENNATARTNIGLGSASAVTFGTLTATNGTITASAPVLDLSQTWNNGSVTFAGMRLNVTNTASASDSLLLLLQRDAGTQFAVNRFGDAFSNYWRFVSLNAGMWVHSVGGQEVAFGSSPNHWFTMTSTRLRLAGDISLGRSGSAGQAVDCILVRDDAGILAQRNAANPQAYRIYNTFTDANNHERGFMRWSSNVFQIGTEKAGTGSARALEFQTDGVTRLIISAGGSVVHGLSNGVIGWTSSTILRPVSGNGTLVLYNNAQTDFNRLQFGGTDATFPALKRSSTTLQVRLADDSAFAPFACAGLTLNGDLTASTRNIVTDATTGTRIGTATTQLLGFWNAAPSAQPAAVADATDAATAITQLNALLSRLRTIGLIAT